ncbi:endothelial cell-specific molecule 1-like [Myxocyprinus asiaticus]|uniref:endothelial cell-specific molecule 1-like n=1 Tax=Myxocyprinus asiaticus TaxID=70543 RepID=UPI0022237AFA|nr:endothelial cell-specific molecule 1-like [Myxocyprinus asiaticus]
MRGRSAGESREPGNVGVTGGIFKQTTPDISDDITLHEFQFLDDSRAYSTQRCRRTVLDDSRCCQVCAAGRGDRCYRTVSWMHGVKCGPGLFCDFYKDEDDYGDEYGICKDCMYGSYGVECRKTCKCKARGLCDRETGTCLSFKFLAKMAMLKSQSNEGNDLGLGDSSNSDASIYLSSARNFLPPR